jgi:uncharacterized membrane protein YhaH (DUF805 family)
MFAALFSFSGRIGRADFILWSAFQAILSASLIAGIQRFSADALTQIQGSDSIGAPIPDMSSALTQGLALVVLPSSALTIKRLRDLGLPAWPCFIVISIVDTLITSFVPATTGFAHGPFAGLAFSLAVAVLLALVPGHGSRTDADTDGAEVDWVARAAAAEAKLLEDRRANHSMPRDQHMLLASRRQDPAVQGEPRGFGRRHAGRQ